MNEARKVHPVKIKVDYAGRGEIEIAGRKFGSYANGFQVICQVGQVPKVLLHTIATEGLEIELDALVDVEVTHLDGRIPSGMGKTAEAEDATRP